MLSLTQVAVPGEDQSPALALVNSCHGHRGGPVDHLAGPRETGRWLADRDLLDESAVLADADVADLRKLREAIREVFLARTAGHTPDPTAVGEINAATAAAPRAATLHWSTTDQPSRTWTATGHGNVLDQARATIAADAIDLVCGDRAPTLHACGGPGCIRLFLRNHPRRVWCSPRCGERVRATRYYRRHRPS